MLGVWRSWVEWVSYALVLFEGNRSFFAVPNESTNAAVLLGAGDGFGCQTGRSRFNQIESAVRKEWPRFYLWTEENMGYAANPRVQQCIVEGNKRKGLQLKVSLGEFHIVEGSTSGSNSGLQPFGSEILLATWGSSHHLPRQISRSLQREQASKTPRGSWISKTGKLRQLCQDCQTTGVYLLCSARVLVLGRSFSWTRRALWGL